MVDEPYSMRESISPDTPLHHFWKWFSLGEAVAIILGISIFALSSFPARELPVERLSNNQTTIDRLNKEEPGSTAQRYIVSEEGATSVIYAVHYNNKPSLLYKGDLYIGDGALVKKGEFEENNLGSTVPVLEVLSDTEIVSHLSSNDGNVLVYTPRMFLKATRLKDGFEEMLDQVWAGCVYDFGRDFNTCIFVNGQLASYKYPVIREIKEDNGNHYLKFDTFGCWECHGHHPEMILYDLSKKRLLNLGRISDFRWLEEGRFEYKDFIIRQCDPVEDAGGDCFVSPEKLPWKAGSWDKSIAT